MNRFRRWISAGMAVLMAAGLTACGSGAENQADGAAAADDTTGKTALTVRISNFTGAGTVAPYYVAVDYGFLEEAFADTPYEVTLEISDFANGAAAVEAAQAGELDILTSGDQMITTAILENGLPFKVIGANYVNRKWAFVAGADSGIKTSADLKGKKVGVQLGNNQYLATLAFLEDNGYSVDDVEVVNLVEADAYTALLSGDIDWALLTGKRRESALNDEGGVLLGYNGDYKFNECVFGVSDSFAEAYPEVVTDLVRAFYDAAEYANENPDAVRDVLREHYDSDDETIEYALGDTEYVVDLTDEIQESIQRTLHYAYAQGINSREADISEVLDLTYLEEAGIHE